MAMIAVRALSFLQTVILARLLQPTDFGLVMMVDVIVSLASIPGGAGIGTALIQRRTLSREAFSSLYWLNVFLGIGAYSVVVISAPWIAAAYREPRLLNIVAWAALPLVLGSFGIPFQSLVERSLDFRKIARIELVVTAAGAVIAVATAFAGGRVFALIAGNVSSSLLRSILLVAKGWPLGRLAFRLKTVDVREDLVFGLNLAGQRLANFIGSNVDFLLIGAFVGARSLGYYVLAYNLVNIPSNYINAVFSRVAYPVLAQLQEDPDRMKRAYLRVQEITAAINFPILFGMAAVASIAIPVVYGQAWAESVPLLEILVVLGLGRSIVGTIGPLIFAKGRTDLGFRWSLMVLSLQIPGLYIGVRSGSTAGVAAAFSILMSLYTVLNYRILVRTLLGPCLKEYLRTMWVPFLFSLAMMVVVFGVRIASRGLRPPVALALLVATGAAVYVTLLWAFRPAWRAEFWNLVSKDVM
jgi:lipopolysaccharide exporter